MMNDNIFAALIFLPIMAMLTAILAFTPYLTRKTEAFGVSIPASEFNNEQINSYRRAYRNKTIIAGVIFILLSLLIMAVFPSFAPVCISFAFFMLAANFLIYYKYHKLMKLLKQQNDWQRQTTSEIAVDVSPSGSSYISPLWLAVNPIIVAATVIFTLYVYPSLPDKIPSHYDFAGNITGYMQKSMLSVMFMPLLQLFLTAIFTFIHFVVKYSRRQIDLENKEESIKRVAIFRKAWGYFNTLCGIGLVFGFAIGQLAIFGLIPVEYFSIGLTAYALAIVVASIVLSFAVGQGGSRIKLSGKDGRFISARDDDKYWKLGTFYYNPDDPALFVEKRFGIGWTSNFARPMTYVFIFGLIAFIVFIFYLTSRLA